MKYFVNKVPLILISLVWVSSLILLWQESTNERRFFYHFNIAYLIIWGLIFFFSKEDTKEKGLRFFLSGMTILLVISFFEIFTLFRLIDYRDLFNTPLKHFNVVAKNNLDPELIFIHKPNTRITGIAKGGFAHLFDVDSPNSYKYDVQYDQNGFRNPGDLESAEIVVMGDSFIEGVRVSQQELTTSVLSRSIKQGVGNLGHLHYGPRQLLVLLKRYALSYHPKIIFWTFFEGNDLEDIEHYDSVMMNWEKYADSVNTFWKRSFTKNVFLAMFRVFGNVGSRPSAEKRSAYFRGQNGALEKTYFLYPGMPVTSKDRKRLKIAGSIFEEAYLLCKDRGIKLVVVFAPTKYRVLSQLVNFNDDFEGVDWIVNDLPIRLKTILEDISKDIGFADLTPGLFEAAKDGKNPFFGDDAHWSPIGHSEVAAALERYLTISENRIGITQ